MADLLTVRKRLEQYIISRGHTFREISLKIGRKDSYIQQYIKYGFPRRLNELDRKKICLLLKINEKDLIDDELIQNSAENFAFAEFPQMLSSPKDIATIDIISPLQKSSESTPVIGRLALNYKEFFGLFNANLKMLRHTGDNMEPSVPSGCLIAYDTGITRYAGDALYIINYQGTTVLKRLQKTPSGTYILKNDNPRYQDTTVTKDDFKIIGRATDCLILSPL